MNPWCTPRLRKELLNRPPGFKPGVHWLTVAASVMVAPMVHAASGTWTNGLSGGVWSAATHWSGGVVADGVGFTADFSAINITADPTVVHLDSARTIGSLSFGDTNTASAAGWWLDNHGVAANVLILAGPSPTITVNALASGRAATLSATLGGTAGFSKTGPGSLVLDGFNTNTGAINVSGGTLKFASAGALGDGMNNASSLTISGSGILDLGGMSPMANPPLTLNSTANGWDVGAFYNSASTTSVYSGPITLGRQIRIGAGNVLLTGPISGGGYNFIKDGLNSLELTNSGAVTLGALQVNRGTLAVDAGTTLNVTGINVGSGNSVGSALTLNGGEVHCSGLTRFGTGIGSASGTLNLNGGMLTVTNLAKGSVTFNVNFNGGTLKAGADNPGFLTNATSLKVLAGGALVDDGGFAIAIMPPLTGTSSTGGGLTKLGNGTLTLAGTNDYPGDTRVGAGRLRLAVPSLHAGSEVTVSNGAVLDLDFTGTNEVRSLVLNGALQPPGIYSSTSSAPHLAGPGNLYVTQSTGLITLDPAATYQQIHGIGANFCLGPQGIAWNNSQFSVAFSPTGLNLTFVRLANSFECWLDEPSIFWQGWDYDNVRFIQMYRAMQPRGLITMSAWSPPASYKSTGSAMGGTLAKSGSAYRYADYADWWLRSLQYLRDNSTLPVEQAIPDFISIQNEPDFTPSGTFYAAWQAGCYLSGTETSTKAGYPQAFAAVKSAFQSNGFGFVKFIGPDTTTGNPSTISGYLNNLPGGSLAAIAHHPYQGSVNDVGHNTGSLSGLRAAYPNWTIYMTEFFGDDSYGAGVPGWMMHGLPIHNLLTIEQANTYLMWGLSLSPTNDTFCALGHYSKFVGPGALRANVITTDTNVLVSLYRYTNSPGIADKLVLVMINTNSACRYPNLLTSNYWASDPLQRSWKVYQTANDGTNSYRLTLLEEESGVGLSGNRSLRLPPYSLTTAIINTGFYTNAPPYFTSTASSPTINPGQTLRVTNTAADPNVPAQTLTFSLPLAPSGATIDSSNGILSWRPLISQANSANPFRVVVTDNGLPPQSATQTFGVYVSPVTVPTMTAPDLGDGQFQATVAGMAGPDYVVQASTNLTTWTNLFSTNPAVLPFGWSDPAATNYPSRFYRVLLGP